MKSLFIFLVFTALTFSIMEAQGHLKAEYYNGINFEEYVGTQSVSNLDFYWDQEAPISGINPNSCSILYTGQLKSPISGNVTIHARVDDGILVWINETLVISNWQLNDVGYSDGTIYLEADTNYDITIKYFNAMKEAELRLLWSLPDDPNKSWFEKLWDNQAKPNVIPSEFFSAPRVIKPRA